MRVVDTTDQRGSRRQQFGEFTKRGFHMLDVPVDVGVVEFDTGHDHGRRAVMEKLRPLVEVSAVVLVTLHSKELPAARIGQTPEIANAATH